MIPFDTFQVLSEQAPHCKLSRRAEVEELSILVEKDFPGVCSQILVQQESLDVQSFLREGDRRTHLLDSDAVIDP